MPSAGDFPNSNLKKAFLPDLFMKIFFEIKRFSRVKSQPSLDPFAAKKSGKFFFHENDYIFNLLVERCLFFFNLREINSIFFPFGNI